MFKKGIEQKYTNFQAPFKISDNLIRTEVVLDYSPGKAPAELIFNDGKTDVTVLKKGNITTTTTTFEAGVTNTYSPEINFKININTTKDGKMIPDDELTLTDQHEAGHSGGLEHPWEKAGERGIPPEINQNSLFFLRDTKKTKDNLMNSFENPDPTLKNNNGNELLPSQLNIVTKNASNTGYSKELKQK